MSKSKININELLKDLDNIFNLVNEVEKSNPNLKALHKKAHLIIQKLTKKYSKDLDTEK